MIMHLERAFAAHIFGGPGLHGQSAHLVETPAVFGKDYHKLVFGDHDATSAYNRPAVRHTLCVAGWRTDR